MAVDRLSIDIRESIEGNIVIINNMYTYVLNKANIIDILNKITSYNCDIIDIYDNVKSRSTYLMFDLIDMIKKIPPMEVH